jgi:hypothetical protein
MSYLKTQLCRLTYENGNPKQPKLELLGKVAVNLYDVSAVYEVRSEPTICHAHFKNGGTVLLHLSYEQMLQKLWQHTECVVVDDV